MFERRAETAAPHRRRDDAANGKFGTRQRPRGEPRVPRRLSFARRESGVVSPSLAYQSAKLVPDPSMKLDSSAKPLVPRRFGASFEFRFSPALGRLQSTASLHSTPCNLAYLTAIFRLGCSDYKSVGRIRLPMWLMRTHGREWRGAISAHARGPEKAHQRVDRPLLPLPKTLTSNACGCGSCRWSLHL